jgi:hypothetical protein
MPPKCGEQPSCRSSRTKTLRFAPRPTLDSRWRRRRTGAAHLSECRFRDRMSDRPDTAQLPSKLRRSPISTSRADLCSLVTDGPSRRIQWNRGRPAGASPGASYRRPSGRRPKRRPSGHRPRSRSGGRAADSPDPTRRHVQPVRVTVDLDGRPDSAAASRTRSTSHAMGGRRRTYRPRAWPQILIARAPRRRVHSSGPDCIAQPCEMPRGPCGAVERPVIRRRAGDVAPATAVRRRPLWSLR